MGKWHQVLVLVWLAGLACGDDTYEQEEEDMNYFLGRLYEDTNENVLDPHDMLNYPGKKPQKPKRDPTLLGSSFTAKNQDTCQLEKYQLAEETKLLEECQKGLENLERRSQVDKQKLNNMERKLISEGAVDMKAFYRRSVYHIWNALGLGEAQDILKGGDEALIRHLVVCISSENVAVLQQFLENQDNVQEVDEFLQDAFVLQDIPEVSSPWSIHSVFQWVTSALQGGKNVEVWLNVSCIGFVLLCTWAIYLFIRDIQQELRWMRVLIMMIVLVFFICCLWHWRHMHKVAESRRHAQMMKRGFTNVPEECKPGVQVTHSVWEWIKVRAFGAPDICEKYFEELMVDPSEEITPAMVIAETLAKFFFQPLQHLGSESAKFITNFYQNVPVVYHIPATVFFVVLLIIILFAFCGYGIDFPLWLGGIRPIYKMETADTSEVERIKKEAISQLQADREKFLKESHLMLSAVVQAATAPQLQAGTHPLMQMSYDIINSQLEQLITSHLSDIVHPTIANARRVRSSQLDSARHNPRIDTITSTPHTLQRMDSSASDGQDIRAYSEKSLLSNDDSEYTGGRRTSLAVDTDAVHYRLKGSPRKKELPPRDVQGHSDSNRSESRKSTLERRRKQSLEGGADNSLSESTTGASHSVLRRRPIKSRSEDSGSESRFSTPQSSQTIQETSFGKSLRDETDSSENFLTSFRSILEESLNSSCEDSDVTDSGRSSRCINRGFDASQTENVGNEEEIELSSDGVKFLGKIKKEMKP